MKLLEGKLTLDESKVELKKLDEDVCVRCEDEDATHTDPETNEPLCVDCYTSRCKELNVKPVWQVRVYWSVDGQLTGRVKAVCPIHSYTGEYDSDKILDAFDREYPQYNYNCYVPFPEEYSKRDYSFDNKVERAFGSPFDESKQRKYRKPVKESINKSINFEIIEDSIPFNKVKDAVLNGKTEIKVDGTTYYLTQQGFTIKVDDEFSRENGGAYATYDYKGTPINTDESLKEELTVEYIVYDEDGDFIDSFGELDDAKKCCLVGGYEQVVKTTWNDGNIEDEEVVFDNSVEMESLEEDKDNKGNSISDDEIMEILCLSDDLLGDTEEEQQKNKKEYCRLFRGLLKKGYNKNDIYDCCDSLLNEFDEDEIIDQSPGGDLVVAIHKEDYEESLKEAKEDDKKSDKKDDKKSSKKDTKKKDKKEDEEDIDIEDEIDIDVEDDKDLPDVDVDDMLSLDDIDIDVDEPIIDEPTEEIPQEIVSGAKLGELQNAVRDEFGSIDHLKSLIATITLDDENAQEGDEDLIDIINGAIDLKYELIGMLNKGIELLDGETVELMDKGEERAEDILDGDADIDIDDIEIEDGEDVFGGGQDLEITDKFDVDRAEDIDVESSDAKSLFDIDDEGIATDEIEDDVVIKDKKPNKK